MMLFTMELLAGAAGTNSVTNAPAEKSATAQNDFEAFRIIVQRNIFNPNRSSRGPRRGDGEGPRTVKNESFALVGTMLYEGGQFAFLDSSSSGYRKVLKVGDSVAGAKIIEVAANGIKLELNGKNIDLAVGQQMSREDEGEWKVGGRAAVETSSSAGTSSTSSASSADEDETLKRLMKKREEEMSK